MAFADMTRSGVRMLSSPAGKGSVMVLPAHNQREINFELPNVLSLMGNLLSAFSIRFSLSGFPGIRVKLTLDPVRQPQVDL
jgi:hypothetical protein